MIHDRSESVPSRATDVPSSTLKDSGYGDVANESSRNISPEDYQPILKPPHFGGGGLLKTITDGLEEEASSRDESPAGVIREKPSTVKVLDRPELISSSLPSQYIDNRYIPVVQHF